MHFMTSFGSFKTADEAVPLKFFIFSTLKGCRKSHLAIVALEGVPHKIAILQHIPRRGVINASIRGTDQSI